MSSLNIIMCLIITGIVAVIIYLCNIVSILISISEANEEEISKRILFLALYGIPLIITLIVLFPITLPLYFFLKKKVEEIEEYE